MPAPFVVQVSVSPGGMPKLAVSRAHVSIEGLAGDWQLNRKYHGGRERAVCLFSVELYDRLRAADIDLPPGSVGENLTTAGIDLDSLKPGSTLRVGDACVIRMTKVREPCRSLHQWDPRLMKLMLGHSGWVARVLTPGDVAAGDRIELAAD